MRQSGHFATGQAGRRFFAVFWVLCAALALQLAATTESIALHQTGKAAEGKFSVPLHGEPEQALSRPSVRVGKLGDLRFSEKRPDAKQALGGPDPLLSPADLHALPASALPAGAAPDFRVRVASPVNHFRQARAPPAIIV